MQPAVIDPGPGLIIGLGNPGAKYEQTRHNAGFWLLDRLAGRFALDFRGQAKFQGQLAELVRGGRKILFLKPATYMNHSGRSAAAVAGFYKIPVERIVVAHDELDLPPGTVRLKRGGGHGGHNGLRDLAALGSREFWRLRLGVGHPGHKDAVVDYVLSKPGRDDRALIDAAVDKTLEAMDLILDGQMEKAMNQLHSK